MLDPTIAREQQRRWLSFRSRVSAGLDGEGAPPKADADRWMEAPLPEDERAALGAHLARAARADALQSARRAEMRWWNTELTLERSTRSHADWLGATLVGRARALGVLGERARSSDTRASEGAVRRAFECWRRFDVGPHADVAPKDLPSAEAVLERTDSQVSALAERMGVATAFDWFMQGAQALRAELRADQRHRRVLAPLAASPLAAPLGSLAKAEPARGRSRVFVLAPSERVLVRVAQAPGLVGELDAAASVGRALGECWSERSLPPAVGFPVASSLARAMGALLALLQQRSPARRLLASEQSRRRRWVAAYTVLQLRVAAASSLAQGPHEAFASLAGRAFGVPAGPLLALALRPVSARLRLRGLLGGLRLGWSLREHFDEDWYRNPRGVEPLIVGLRRGGSGSVEGLLEELGDPSFDGAFLFLDELVDRALT
ncbi:MAG: hypothetical protein AAF645_14320 [Myxococcota bacterium]